MALGRALGQFIQPVAPGLPGAINPLTFIGAGMASGNMGAAMGQMANIQQAQQQIGIQQAQMDMMRQQQAQKAAAARQAAQQRALMQQVALGMLPKRPMEAEGPPTAEGEAPTAMQHTPEQLVMAMAMPDAVAEATLNPLPIEGGKGGFFNPLTGQIMGAPAAGPAGQAMPPGYMPIDQFYKETDPADFSPESYSAALAQAAQTGGVDMTKLQPRKPVYGYKEEQELAGKYEDYVKVYKTGLDKANQVMRSLNMEGPISDVGTIFSFIGALDPGSVVRESEVDLIQNAAGVINQLRALGQRAKGEGVITPEVRTEMRAYVGELQNLYLENLNRDRAKFEQRASAYEGIRPGVVVGEPFTAWQARPSPQQASQLPSAPDPALVEEGLKLYGQP